MAVPLPNAQLWTTPSWDAVASFHPTKWITKRECPAEKAGGTQKLTQLVWHELEQ